MALQLHSDPQRNRERLFVARLADFLSREFDACAFDELVVSAAPRTLGDLKTAFVARLTHCVIELDDYDYTRSPDREMIDALRRLADRE
jgi:protein required for attachment to host cells